MQNTAGIVTAITGILASMVPNEKQLLEEYVEDGVFALRDLDDFFHKNPQYDRIEVRLPFIEYNVNRRDIRFVMGKGRVTRVHAGRGWIDL